MGWLQKNYPRFEAEDFVQITLYRVYQNAAGYRGECHAQAKDWVFTILRHAVYDYFRSGWDQVQELETLPLERRPPEDWRERDLDLQIWLRKNLTPREQQILAMRVQGYTQAEIGLALDLSGPRVNQILRELAEKIRCAIQRRDEAAD